MSEKVYIVMVDSSDSVAIESVCGSLAGATRKAEKEMSRMVEDSERGREQASHWKGEKSEWEERKDLCGQETVAFWYFRGIGDSVWIEERDVEA